MVDFRPAHSLSLSLQGSVVPELGTRLTLLTQLSNRWQGRWGTGAALQEMGEGCDPLLFPPDAASLSCVAGRRGQGANTATCS